MLHGVHKVVEPLIARRGIRGVQAIRVDIVCDITLEAWSVLFVEIAISIADGAVPQSVGIQLSCEAILGALGT